MADSSSSSLPSEVLAALDSPTTLRNDLAFLAGVVGVVAGVVAPHWHMPVVPDTMLIAASGLLALGVRIAHTFSRNGLNKAGLASDAAFLKGQVPGLQADVDALKPALDKVPGLEGALGSVSDDVARVKETVSGLQDQVAKLPDAQRQAVQEALARVADAVVTSPAAATVTVSSNTNGVQVTNAAPAPVTTSTPPPSVA